MIDAKFIEAITAKADLTEIDPDAIADALWLVSRNLFVPHFPDPTFEPSKESKESKESKKSKKSGSHLASEPEDERSPPPLPEPGPPGPVFTKNPIDVVLPGNKSGQGISVKTPGARSLPGERELLRALRQFRRRVASRTKWILDEERTVHRVAENRIWAPVEKPDSARRFEIALVIDDAPSMDIWRNALKELRLLLERLGGFKDVRVWWMDTLSKTPTIHASQGKTSGRRPEELITPDGRRVILIASDCLSPGWKSSFLADLIKKWGKHQPVVLLQMLPQRLWKRTYLGAEFIEPVYVGSKNVGSPNGHLDKEFWRGADGDTVPKEVPLPVITTDPELISAWAKMLFRPSAPFFPAVIFNPERNADLAPGPDPAVRPTVVSAQENDPTAALRTVGYFRNTSSKQAFRLATLLAAAPLRLPVMRLVQRTLLPSSRQVDLAEFFLSGLVQRKGELNAAARKDPDVVDYEFLPGVREILLTESVAAETVQVLRAVSEYLADRFGQSLDIDAMIDAPDTYKGKTMPTGSGVFAQIAAQVLSRLGGQYANVAKALRHNESPFLNKRLLWVDDVPENNRAYEDELRMEGATIIHSLSTENALEKLRGAHIDAVLSDVRRGDDKSAGFTLLDEMKQQYPAIPVAIFSSYRAIRFAKEALIRGAIISTNDFAKVRKALAEHFTKPKSVPVDWMDIYEQISKLPEYALKFLLARAFWRCIAKIDRPANEDGVQAYLRDCAEFFELALIPSDSPPPSPLIKRSSSKTNQFIVTSAQTLVPMVSEGRISLDELMPLFADAPQDLEQTWSGLLEPMMADLRHARLLPKSAALETAPSLFSAFPQLETTVVSEKPTRWVLVVGSGEGTSELAVVSGWLGHTLAMAGFGLITGGWPGVDGFVTKAFVERVSIWGVNIKNWLTQILEPGVPVRIPEGEILGFQSTSEAIDRCVEKADAVILVNGLKGTHSIARIASKKGIPVIPLKNTGGAAQQFAEELMARKHEWPSRIPQPNWQALSMRGPAAICAVPRELRRLFAEMGSPIESRKGRVLWLKGVNQDIRHLVLRLSDQNWAVSETDSIDNALTRLREEKYDAVLAGMHLQEGEFAGLTLLDSIRDHTEYNTIPFIIYSRTGGPPFRAQVLSRLGQAATDSFGVIEKTLEHALAHQEKVGGHIERSQEAALVDFFKRNGIDETLALRVNDDPHLSYWDSILSATDKDPGDLAVQIISVALHCKYVQLFDLVEGERLILYAAEIHGGKQIVEEVSPGGIIGEAIRTRRSTIAGDVKEQSRSIPIEKSTRSQLAVPVIEAKSERVIAVFNIESPLVMAFGKRQVFLIEMLAKALGGLHFLRSAPPIDFAASSGTDDRNKGRFGGEARSSHGVELIAEIDSKTSNNKYCAFDLIVRSTNGVPLQSPVFIYLHDSYVRSKIPISWKEKERLEVRHRAVSAYETFTVGAQVRTTEGLWQRLELDLGSLPAFRRWAPPGPEPEPSPSIAFVFQSRRDEWSLWDNLKPNLEVPWKVSRYGEHLRKGSLVLFWQAKGKGSASLRGLWGWGVTVSDPQNRKGRGSIKVKCVEKWLREKPEAPLPATEISKMEAWDRHPLNTTPMGTNFRVNKDQLESVSLAAQTYAINSQLPAAVEVVKAGKAINLDAYEARSVQWEWNDEWLEPIGDWMELPQREIRGLPRVEYSDPVEEKHGDSVSTRGHHVLNLPARFKIMPNPVTNESFVRFIRYGGYENSAYWTQENRATYRIRNTQDFGPAAWFSPSSSGHLPLAPVSGICWYEAKAFIRWLNDKYPQEGWSWMLPTEDMWEFAARGPEGRIYPWGNHFEKGLCNSVEAKIGTTSDVRNFVKGASVYGGVDFAGNVWEFVDEEPAEAKSRSCILRGGSYLNKSEEVKSNLRLLEVPRDHRALDFGFRCALVPSTSDSSKFIPA